MIELTILNYLKIKLSPIPVYLEQPTEKPKQYVMFEKTSSSKENHLKASTFAFQSYAESLYKAAELNEIVKDKVEEMIELDKISKIKLNSDYNFTDTETKRYRYQAVFDINHY
ncbi:hypothetical protein [Microaceticoccus formicicus]|uniref:hypothetical protein n=1 Tax=Microaceticoccus formicicus TaxID=3118105 RepID=UPI003CD0038F|nr:hypothetical protein VZL98_04985 [Peptoniphilaceae bacterium AMB_02]